VVAADLLRLRAGGAAAGRCRAAAVRATGCCLLLPACPCLGDWSPRAGRARWRGAPVPPPPVGHQSAATRS